MEEPSLRAYSTLDCNNHGLLNSEYICLKTILFFEFVIEIFVNVLLLFTVQAFYIVYEVHWILADLIDYISMVLITVHIRNIWVPSLKQFGLLCFQQCQVVIDRRRRAATDRRILEMYSTNEHAATKQIIITEFFRKRVKNFQNKLKHRIFGEDRTPEDRTDCTICCTDFNVGEVITSLEPFCSHWYHRECIKKWLLGPRIMPRECPTCRAEIHIDGEDPVTVFRSFHGYEYNELGYDTEA